MALIESLVEAAAVLYRGGMKLPAAVGEALDQYRISDVFERKVLYSKVCSALGKRGASRRRNKARLERKPSQISLPFSVSVKRDRTQNGR